MAKGSAMNSELADMVDNRKPDKTDILQKIKSEDFNGMQFFGENVDGKLRVHGVLGDAEALDEIPFGIYLMNQDGTLNFFNKSCTMAWGRSPNLADGEKYCGSHKLFYPSGERMPHEVSPPMVALKNGADIRNVDAVCEQPNGTRLLARADIFSIKNEAGETVGAVNFFRHNPNKTVPGLYSATV